MLVAYLLVFAGGFTVSLTLQRLVLPLAIRLGYMDHPTSRKLHTVSVPYGGGVAIFLSLATLGGAAWLLLNAGLGKGILSDRVNLEAIITDPRSLAIALGGIAIFLLGLWDDVFDMPPRVKLLLQAMIWTAVLLKGKLTLSFFVPMPAMGLVVTLVWVLLITNSFNLLDNMDGLCAGVTLLTLVIHLVILTTGLQQYLVGMLTVLLFAIVLAFFLFNKPPARMYLGDAGSLQLGYYVAVLSILSTYYCEGQALTSIFTPILILAMPIYDVATVMYIRWRIGKPFFKGDKNHFSHRLLQLGFSPRQALLVICALASAMGLSAILLYHSSEPMAAVIFLQALLLFVVVRVIEHAGLRLQRKDGPDSDSLKVRG